MYKACATFFLFLFIHCSFAQDTIHPPEIIEEPYPKNDSVKNFSVLYPGDVPTLHERKIDERSLQKFANDDAFWYANEAAPKEAVAEQPQTSLLYKLSRQDWFRTLIRMIIAGAFIAVLLWFLASSNINLFRKSLRPIDDGDANELPENIFSIDYNKEINNAVNSGDFRVAVRLMYLQTLKILSENNIIRYQQQKTNTDYLVQLFNTKYYKDFFRLTRNFEYSWYGQFNVSDQAFRNIKNDFENFKKRLPG